jgi:hypothetical protein
MDLNECTVLIQADMRPLHRLSICTCSETDDRSGGEDY